MTTKTTPASQESIDALLEDHGGIFMPFETARAKDAAMETALELEALLKERLNPALHFAQIHTGCLEITPIPVEEIADIIRRRYGQGWIKCSERMPTEKDGDHLGRVCWANRATERLARWDADLREAIWWMPVLEYPPKPEGDGS